MSHKLLNEAMQLAYSQIVFDSREMKALFRANYSLSSDEADNLVAECRSVHSTIKAIAQKSFGGKTLSDVEEGYLDSLPLDKPFKSKLWQAAMLAQFR